MRKARCFHLWPKKWFFLLFSIFKSNLPVENETIQNSDARTRNKNCHFEHVDLKNHIDLTPSYLGKCQISPLF